MLLGENILTLSLYLYRKKTYSSNLLLLKYDTDMKREPVYIRIYHFYLEGFREMKLGKTLWLIILVKLFIMFFILKLFFFPNYLKLDGDSAKEEHVSGELINRAITP
jgi:hypothetical protein